MISSCVLSSNAEDVTFNRIWADYNVYEDGMKGMKVHCDLNIKNYQGKKLLYTVQFGINDEDYLKRVVIKSDDSKFSYHGNLCPRKRLNVTYQNSHWEDLCVFVPYKLFPNNPELSYQIVIYNEKDNSIVEWTDCKVFRYTSNKKSPSDMIDNTNVISRLETEISNLVNEKENCYQCHGSGYIRSGYCIACSGKGYTQVGYSSPQFLTCSFCQGTGKNKNSCYVCSQRQISLNIKRSALETAKETNGMSQESYQSYLNIKGEMMRQQREWQQTVNDMCDPYLNSTHSSSSSSSTKSNCNICNGTGFDPFPWGRGSNKPHVGGYTHPGGSKCRYCTTYEWHQHVYCPKCQANKYP